MTTLLDIYKLNSDWDSETLVNVSFTDRVERKVMNLNDALHEYDDYIVKSFRANYILIQKAK